MKVRHKKEIIRDVTIAFRITKEKKDLLQAEADKGHRSLSMHLHMLLDMGIKLNNEGVEA